MVDKGNHAVMMHLFWLVNSSNSARYDGIFHIYVYTYIIVEDLNHKLSILGICLKSLVKRGDSADPFLGI
jgi:hypothetical protein